MKTQEQIKAASDAVSMLQDYITLAKIEKSLKCELSKGKVSETIDALRDGANTNVGEVL